MDDARSTSVFGRTDAAPGARSVPARLGQVMGLVAIAMAFLSLLSLSR